MTEKKECALCQRTRSLCKSHIIPEFCYRPIYDKIGRGVVIDPLTGDRYRYIQNGIYEKLLCEECERFLNETYEKPFKQSWYDNKPIDKLRDLPLISVNVDYRSFKLFHLSILFRSSVAKHTAFSEVELTPKRIQELRRMLLEIEPYEDMMYPILCSAIWENDKIWDTIIGPPSQITLEGCEGYYVVFGGCQWFYFISGHQLGEFAAPRLRSSGKLPVAKMPFRYIDHVRELRGNSRRQWLQDDD